ncbi:MAG: class I tRNA ligase family protein [Lachnospiraceae bacterium]|nr:class I tRNA ligase family protein [Lachnospiraceae bacterium]
MKILVGSAWPYTNESLHMGQIAAWLPADVIARYHRAKGDSVYYVSGSDCHGEPVLQKAIEKGCRPQEVSDCYHAEFKQCFRKMGFSFDCYTKTTYVEHKEFVRDFHRALYRSPYVYERDSLDGNGKQLYIALSQLRNQLENLIRLHPEWEKVDASLKDMPLTTNLQWGIDVPHLGFEQKKIYVWAENVLGYLSASKICAERRGEEFKELWSKEAKHYYVYGKENISFHTLLLPGMLSAQGEGYKFPDQMIVANHLTIDNKVMSVDNKNAIWVKDIVNAFEADSIRYYLLSNGIEEADCEFAEEKITECHNHDLVEVYSNFINRIVVFIEKYYNRYVPEGMLDTKLGEQIDRLYEKTGAYIEKGKCKEALQEIFAEIHRETLYLEKRKPWKLLDSNPEECANIMYNSLQIAANILVLMHPFLPFSSEKMLNQLSLQPHWNTQLIEPGYRLKYSKPLFSY